MKKNFSRNQTFNPQPIFARVRLLVIQMKATDHAQSFRTTAFSITLLWCFSITYKMKLRLFCWISILSALCSRLNEGKSLRELIRVAEKHSFSRSLELVRSCLDFRVQIMPPFGLRNLMRSHLVCELEFPRPPFDSKALSSYESMRFFLLSLDLKLSWTHIESRALLSESAQRL